MTDYRAQFKAAKAQRESAVPGKMSKEQIRALKAKKAAAAAQEAKDAANQREKEGAARAAASSAPPLPRMPPPAPRPAKASKPVPPPPKFGDPVPFRPDSQATIITPNGSTPSFDGTLTGVGPRVSAAASIEAQSTASTNGAGLPSGFFEEAAASAASSLETAASQSGLPRGFFEAPGPSGEDQAEPVGSTAVSEAPLEPKSSTAARLEGSLPRDFFEDTRAGDVEAEAGGQAVQASASGQPEMGSSAIPKGFFANADADAKARGEKPAKPRSKDEQFTDFMASIAADVKEAQVHDEEEAAAEAAERAEREVFEQRMRQQRIEELKGGASSTSAAAAETLGFAEVALDISSIAEGAAPPRKRRRLDVLDVDEDVEDEDSEDDEMMLDWRAKTV